jgi:hypothetical protein
MPGLPRKSTVRQFKKLMKKSGKARTNKASGGSDPSTHRIATYEQFCIMKEGIKWYSKGKLSKEIEDDIEDGSDRIGQPFPNSIDELQIGDVFTSKDNPGNETFTVTNIVDNFQITFLTSGGSRFIMPFEKVKSFCLIGRHSSRFR